MDKMFRFSILLFLLFSFSNCKEDKNPCALSENVLRDIEKLDSLTHDPQIRQRDIGSMKANFNEPSLLNAETETYRFILASSFGESEIDRLEEIDGHYKLIRKIFKSHEDTLGSTSEFEISENEWKKIVLALENYKFWTYPFDSEREGLDGATWSLEGYKPNKDKCSGKNYHRVARWSPIDPTFIAMCDLLYSLREDPKRKAGL